MDGEVSIANDRFCDFSRFETDGFQDVQMGSPTRVGDDGGRQFECLNICLFFEPSMQNSHNVIDRRTG